MVVGAITRGRPLEMNCSTAICAVASCIATRSGRSLRYVFPRTGAGPEALSKWPYTIFSDRVRGRFSVFRTACSTKMFDIRHSGMYATWECCYKTWRVEAIGATNLQVVVHALVGLLDSWVPSRVQHRERGARCMAANKSCGGLSVKKRSV
jgi:hypothetical protein